MYKDHFDFVFDEQSVIPETIYKKGIYGVNYIINDCRLINIFYKRNCDEMITRINSLFETENKIGILGISLRDFFHPDSKFDEVLKSLNKEQKKQLKIRVLILDPFSKQGQIRSKREQGVFDEYHDNEFIRGHLYDDVKRSLKHHTELVKQGFNIEIKLYDASPSCFMFLTNKSLIIEQYHYGAMESQEETNSKDKKDVKSTTVGRKIPVFEYSNESNMYIELQGHFRFIWEEQFLSKTKEQWAEQHNLNIEPFEVGDDIQNLIAN